MIKVTTINIAGVKVDHIWDNFREFKEDWEGDSWSGPEIDDRLHQAEVNGDNVCGDLFGDVLDYLSEEYDWEY